MIAGKDPLMSHSPLNPASSQCLHCGLELSPQQRDHKKEFCCIGCEFIFKSINSVGLGRYYELRGESRSHSSGSVVALEHYRYADAPQFRDDYCISVSEGKWRMTVMLQGIHCAACVWLLERLPIIVAGVLDARVRFADAQIDIVFEERCSLSGLLSEIERLGYRVQPLALSNVPSAEQQVAKRNYLIRIGIAAVCAMNTMMLAISLYQGDFSGMDSRYRNLLQWYSLALTLPVVCYSAIPFYRTALGGLRAGVLHIDVPIVIALLGAFAISVYNTVRAAAGVYYDSVTAVIFLLLIARFMQGKIVEKIAGHGALLSALIPLRARRVLASGESEQVYSGALRIGDRVRFDSGDIVSADGAVVSGTGHLNMAFLTGESLPQRVEIGDFVYAGTKLIDGGIDVECQALGGQSRIGKLMMDVARNTAAKPQIEVFLDRRSRGFTALVVIAAIGTALYWFPISSEIAIERTIALLLVTCPCVLALATPIVFSVGLVRAARQGIIFRSTEIIERLEKITDLIFDKTGTLTSGSMSVSDVWRIEGLKVERLFEETQDQELGQLTELELGIEHPVAHALRGYARKFGESQGSFVQRNLVAGRGIHAISSKGGDVFLGSPQWDKLSARLSTEAAQLISQESARGSTVVAFSPRPETVYLFSVSDRLRPESLPTLNFFRARGARISLLSGDLRKTAVSVAAQVSIPEQECFAPCSPEEKAKIVSERERDRRCAMVGDGINDISALSAAHVGIGIIGGAEASMKVADVYLSDGSMEKLPVLFTGANRVMRAVRLGLIISAGYNIIGAYGACTGMIGPLEAAIIMPLSSLTSILFAATRKTF